MKFEVEVISKEMVKPSSPSPNHLCHYQLSFLDQTMVPIFMPWAMFYPKTKKATSAEICSTLKKSLSEALTLFYPLAGRVKDNRYVECNDQGVPFVQTTANCSVSDIIGDPIPSDLNKLFPYELDDVNDLAAVFQVTFFDCGGMAIAFGMSHKLGDALSYFMFLNSWAAIARGEENGITVPSFDSATYFPPRNIPGFRPTTGIEKDKIVARRFVFDAPTIAALRAKYADKGNNQKYPWRPTRVEALSAFIWNRFKAATGIKANDDENIIYAVLHAVNLRNRMDPPLSERHFGNISSFAAIIPEIAAAATDADDDDHDNESSFTMITQIRDAIKKLDAEYVKSLQQGDEHLNFMQGMAEKVKCGQVVSFNFTSLCRFPVHEADFGWGKPIWAGSARMTFKNLVTFFDTKEGDGIEAWINLKEEDMAKFENDSVFAAYVSSAYKIL